MKITFFFSYFKPKINDYLIYDLESTSYTVKYCNILYISLGHTAKHTNDGLLVNDIHTSHIFFFFIVMIFFLFFFLTLVQIIEINCCFLNHQGQVTLIFMPLILSLLFFLNVYINLSGRNDDFKVVTSEVSQGNFREQFSAQNDKMLVCLFVFFLRTLSVFFFSFFFLFQQNPTTACRC